MRKCFLPGAVAAAVAAVVTALVVGRTEATWAKILDGGGFDWACCVRGAKEGGYIVCGYDAWLAKTDAEGRQQWSKTLGRRSGDRANSLQPTSDGGYVLAGWTMSYGAWLIKTDADGKKQWSKTFGGGWGDRFHGLCQTKDGSYIACGTTESYGDGGSDAWLIKTDAEGEEQWRRTFGGEKDDWLTCVCQTQDGGYILAGGTRSFGHGGSDAWLIKTDAKGKQEWERTFGGGKDDSFSYVCQTQDGAYVVCGQTESYSAGLIGHVYSNACLIKIDAEGKEQWSRTLSGGDRDEAGCVLQTSDGGYIVAGATGSYLSGSRDAWLVKTDAEGEEQWSRTLGGSKDDLFSCVCQTKDGGYIACGTTGSYSYGAGFIDPVYSNAWLIKIDAEGNTPFSK